LKCVCDTFKLIGAELASDLEWSRNLRAQGFQPRPESTLGRGASFEKQNASGKFEGFLKKILCLFFGFGSLIDVV
jgi:hypothetical protein